MKRRQIIHSIEDKYTWINKSFDHVVRHFKEEDIHSFRVEIKKLRAFLRLASTAEFDVHALKVPPKMREFYSSIGCIRSLQIQQERLRRLAEKEHSELPATYMDWLTREITHQSAHTEKIIKDRHPFKKAEHRLLATMPAGLNAEKIRTFIKVKAGALNLLMVTFPIEDEFLHAIRKILKDLQYTWPYIEPEAALLFSMTLFQSQEDIHSTTRLLGDFQDICVSLDLLHAHREHVDEKDKTRMREIARKWQKEKEAAKEGIYKVLQGYSGAR
jgi:CHAD domain-containing protein